MITYTVCVVPVRVRWRRYWELHVEGVGVTQSKRRRGDADRMARDYVHLMTGHDDIEIAFERQKNTRDSS